MESKWGKNQRCVREMGRDVRGGHGTERVVAGKRKKEK